MGPSPCQRSAVRSEGSYLQRGHACYFESYRSIGEAYCQLELYWAVEQPIEDLQRLDSNPYSFR